MNFKSFLQNHLVYLDGGMGTLLQEAGLLPGELPERWNLSHAEEVIRIHQAYFDAGSNVVNTNTFGANILKFHKEELEEILSAAVDHAREAARRSVGKQPKFIALDIGPTGKLLKPYGDFDFEDAVSVFAETVKLGVKCGVDLITIETMNDSYETKAAVLAAKENSGLPIVVTCAYGEDSKLMTGASPAAMVAMLEGLRVDCIGVNCSLGPKQLKKVVAELLEKSSLPVVVKPNAGLPQSDGERTFFDVDEEEFSSDLAEMVREGARVVGGCCGTTPAYIQKLVEKTKNIPPVPVTDKNITCVSSYTHSVEFGHAPVLIGERINPTGKKRFKQALKEGDIDYILGEGVAQQDKGVHVLDVNVGLPDIDEREMLVTCVNELQAVTDLPLQIDTSSAAAMEAALRRYNGKAMVNSVNGKKESMEQVFPLVKKYGGLVVALTLDEKGIPETWEERVSIAKNILSVAESYGIAKKDIIFDTLAMAISADPAAGLATLKALSVIRKELQVNTSLGVSNVSFGLPARDAIHSTFFALALENGLSAAIMNPYSADMLKVYYAFNALHNYDENCGNYISFATETLPSMQQAATPSSVAQTSEGNSPLQRAIVKGLKDQAGLVCKEYLQDRAPLEIVNGEIIPALDIVGRGFEEKRVYLPQLLMSAEAAKRAFDVIKDFMAAKGTSQEKKCAFVIATVKGDIHDIGKNIVKVLLENYGFDVIDLGRDVPPERVAEAVVKSHAPLAGLSALMTTTVPAMEDTIRLLREKAPWCKVVVGGAVLNQEYADRIGADQYAKDAMETVRYAEEIFKTL